MSHTKAAFEILTWRKALSLAERARDLRSHYQTLPSNSGGSDAAQRITEWREQPPFVDHPELFAKRLQLEGLTEKEFYHLIREEPEELAASSNFPKWLTTIIDAYEQDCDTESGNKPVTGASAVTDPLIRLARKRLSEHIRQLQDGNASGIDSTAIARLFEEGLLAMLSNVLSPTIMLELNVARLEGRLVGPTPESRYKFFLDTLRNRHAAIQLLERYPVLVRQIVTIVDQWVQFSSEIFAHLRGDWPLIRQEFGAPANPGALTKVTTGAGDRHHEGRTVTILEFSSGFRVVYKPHSLSVDVCFADFIDWLNEQGGCISLRPVRAIDRGNYGWAEYVQHRGCSSLEEVHRFYERQGAYIAILYILDGADFHSGNLIASGEYPYLVDLEVLFHPRIEPSSIGLHSLSQLALAGSVLRSGLLPFVAVNAEEPDAWLDMSGLGGKPGQLSPEPLAVYEGNGTDEWRIVKKRVAMPGFENVPHLCGKPIRLQDFTEDVVDGFARMYRLLWNSGSKLGGDFGRISRFRTCKVRALLGSTRMYQTFLNYAVHPDYLQNALDRDRLFDRLWSRVPHNHRLGQVIGYERGTLEVADIPSFGSMPGSRDLLVDDNETVSEFFDRAAIENVLSRVDALSQEDLDKQIWFIRASIAAADTTRPVPAAVAFYRSEGAHRYPDPKSLRAAAEAVAKRLESLALKTAGDVCWVGLQYVDEHRWNLQPLSVDLYSGLSGIALFFAYLGAVSGEPYYTTLARHVLSTLRREFHELRVARKPMKDLGMFAGWGGCIYLLTHLGYLWNDRELLADAEEIVGFLSTILGESRRFDIVNGTAGCIGAAIGLYKVTGSRAAYAAVQQCGDKLVRQSELSATCRIWRDGCVVPLTGFSHGAAGVAWALLEAAALTGDEKFRNAGLEAVAYERGLFSKGVNNWPDFREFNEQPRRPVAELREPGATFRYATDWCHGAPGIGLARLSSIGYLRDADTRQEIETALETTLKWGFGRNHCLCHGDLGNLEIFLRAREEHLDFRGLQHADVVISKIFGSICDRGFLCGTPHWIETPGLMNGLAGIGYGLLRIGYPDRVPSVLALEPPC